MTGTTDSSDLVRALQRSRVIDLGQPFHAEMPQPAGLPRFSLVTVRRHGDVTRAEGYSAAHDLLITLNHAGTHIDAIGHVSAHGRLHGDVSADEVQRGTGGLAGFGIQALAPIVRRCVLADVAGFLEVDRLEPAFGIGGDLLQASLQAQGSYLERGDVLLVRTGWGAMWEEPDRYLGQGRGLPGVDADGAEWIAAQGVSATGADCLMYERFDPSVNALPVHLRLVQGAAIPLIENLDLEELATTGAPAFTIVVLPLPLVGGTGSQVRPIALL
ncbi:MAG TPA: cyclase family protein [Candidatus Limnocylindrales bacterium]|nr:cyclase family protein [Candidatus Limnocylindrales bacterium]